MGPWTSPSKTAGIVLIIVPNIGTMLSVPAMNPSNIVFYSDNISVEKNGIGYAGENGSIIFEGNVTLCGGAIRIPDEEDGKLSIVIKGDFNLESGFVSGMLGEYKTSVTIYVSSDKVSLVPVGNYTVLPLEDFNG